MNFATLLQGHLDDHAKARLPAALDRMDHAARLFTCMSIEAKDQKRLWELCAENEALDSSHFVPSGTAPLTEVIHHGKNTLPVHNFFQKRFCTPEAGSEELYGYNHQSLSWLTGPGYYVSHPVNREEDKAAPSDYVINYTRVPPQKAASWPEIIPNKAKLGFLVYAGMKDYMRKVSEHVSIGIAYKGGKSIGSYFLLCREDPAG